MTVFERNGNEKYEKFYRLIIVDNETKYTKYDTLVYRVLKDAYSLIFPKNVLIHSHLDPSCSFRSFIFLYSFS